MLGFLSAYPIYSPPFLWPLASPLATRNKRANKANLSRQRRNLEPKRARPSLLWALLVRGYGGRLAWLGALRGVYVLAKYSQPVLMNLLIKAARDDDDADDADDNKRCVGYGGTVYGSRNHPTNNRLLRFFETLCRYSS